MKTIPAWLAIVAASLSGCQQEPPPPVNESASTMILDAAVSANGIAVGTDVDVLHVNDGGALRDISISSIVQAIAPADTGVWTGGDGEVIFVHKDGEDRYPIAGTPLGILPAGDRTAYVVTMDSILFVGSGDHRAAQRRAWTRYSADDAEEIFHDLEQEAGGGGIHRYDP